MRARLGLMFLPGERHPAQTLDLLSRVAHDLVRSRE